MLKIYTPENDEPKIIGNINNVTNLPELKIFLAGTIDNGDSENWQEEVIKELSNSSDNENFVIYNPRRNNWNASAGNKEVINQIKWEQNYLDEADLIIMNLLDNSKSPISLLELGIYSQQGKIVVFCTNKFYRYINVKLTCEKYYVPLVNSIKVKDIIDYIKNIYKSL